MNEREALHAVGNYPTQAIARTAHADLEHFRGKVIAYCDAPSVLLENENGDRIWWRADLTSIVTEGDQ